MSGSTAANCDKETDPSVGDRSGEPQELSRVERQNLRFVGRLQSQGANFLFVDGSVQPISNTIVPQVWWALGTKAGGESF